VDDAHRVGVGQPPQDLVDDGVEHVEAHHPGAPQPVEQVLALEQLEGDDDAVGRVVLDVEHLRHVIAVDHARGPRLAPEALDGVGARLGVRA